MKHGYLSVFLMSLLFISCVSDKPNHQADALPVGGAAAIRSPYPGPPEIYPLLLRWEQAVRTRNMGEIQAIMPEPRMTYISSGYEELLFTTFRSIESFRFEILDKLVPWNGYRLGTFFKFYDEGFDYIYQFEYSVPGRSSRVQEGIRVINREGEWLISEAGFIDFPDGALVSNHLAARFDLNDDGLLGPGESGFQEALQSLVSGPHPCGTVVDEYFDGNGDGNVSGEEIQSAVELLLYKAVRYSDRALNLRPGNVDTNNNGHLEDAELEKAVQTLSDPGISAWQKQPILQGLWWLTMPDYLFQDVPRKTLTYADLLADKNDDGIIDGIEEEILERGFAGQHPGVSYFDTLIDRNRDGFVGWNEVLRLAQVSAKDWGELTLQPPPYPVRTPTDALLDSDGDGLVGDREIRILTALFAGQTAAAELISPDLRTLLDTDGSGEVTGPEIQQGKSRLFYPRAVREEVRLDGESDTDNSGFLDVVEIGILAGQSAGTPITPFDDRINLYQTQSSLPVQDSPFSRIIGRKNGPAQETSLAVIEVSLGLSSRNAETTGMLTTFIENAFVNLGSVRLVERRNLEKLMNEIRLQMSGVFDEDSAAEIGKLAGADVLAISELSELEGRFFLNIKVVTVETGEILGSSISQTESQEGFLTLANSAVNKLF